MKIFLDSTNIEEIRNKQTWNNRWNYDKSVLDCKIRKKDSDQILKSICKEVKGPVSAEVTAEKL